MPASGDLPATAIPASGVPAANAAPAVGGPPVSQVYTWEPSSAVIAARHGLRPEDILRFDLNTSPAPPGFLAEALAGPFDPVLSEYPDSLYLDLAQAAAAYVGADPAEILVGAGADEVLDIVAKACLPMGGTAIVPIPSYSMYGVLSLQREAKVLAVPRLGPDDGFALDLEAILPRLDGADVVWLCDPNNPTGAAEPEGTVERLLEAASALGTAGPVVVVDEAYHEFRPRSLVTRRLEHPRLVVVRTLSKAFALAGLRVGYAVAARPMIERLERLRPPGSIATVSATVAAQALRRPEVASATARAVAAERDWLAPRLAEIGWPPYPSVTNFLLCPIGSPEEAEAATAWLLRHGIVVRTFGPANPLRGHLRFTVRSRTENERLLEVARSWQEERAR